jgi:predicted RNase H-like nuclease (RuvC/YqgF family)
MVVKRKNPWHKRKVNKCYNELCDKIETNPEVLSKLNKVKDLTFKLSEKAKEVNNIKEEHDNIVIQANKNPDLINLLSIENLDDSFSMERDGYLSKITFSDVVYAGNLKRKGMNIAENNMELVHRSRISQIDLILAQIKVILNDEN